MKNKHNYRVVIDLNDPSFKIADARIDAKNALVSYDGASPYGRTPTELLASFADYEESFNRSFIMIKDKSWAFADGKNKLVKEIRNLIKEGITINFSSNDYDRMLITNSTPPNHYRLGIDTSDNLVSVFQIHSYLNVGSEGEINGACCFDYNPFDFVEDWFMYKNSLKLNMFVTRPASNGMDIVEADLPFTFDEWQKQFNQNNKD